MKALTIRAPWVYLTLRGLKPLENRSRRTNFRGDFLLHAGKTFEGSDNVFGFIQAVLMDMGKTLVDAQLTTDPRDYNLGGFIAVATLTDCIEQGDEACKLFNFYTGQHGWIIENVRPIEFIPYPGQLGFWNVPNEITAQITYL